MCLTLTATFQDPVVDVPLTSPPVGSQSTSDPTTHSRTRLAGEVIDEYLPYTYLLDAPSSPTLACSTPGCQAAATYRCTDCFDPGEYCSSCLRLQHHIQPFHRVERWAGTHFERSSLKEAGSVLNFDHAATSPCPYPDAVDLIVVDVNGMHTVRACYCSCSGYSRIGQLLRHRLFPASPTAPRMAFTFRVLDFFRTFNVVSKTAIFDFLKSLQFLTDPVEPEKVSVSKLSKVDSRVLADTLCLRIQQTSSTFASAYGGT